MLHSLHLMAVLLLLWSHASAVEWFILNLCPRW